MTFYFYDLETSGRSARSHRIMQFAGQRTDKDLNPIGRPDNFLIKLSPDILPEPDAILTNGITPQKTLEEGLSEAEFLKHFNKEIVQAGTTFVGYNNIRFDDEFMRFTLWRNFYDAYEWQWKDSASRWDLLDVARIIRALRPDGIKWPKQDGGNRLENLAKLNKLEHTNAHDALSDVNVLIDLARLFRSKQPKIFDYLLKMRSKTQLEPFIKSGKPFVYTSGRYPKENLHTTVTNVIAPTPEKSSVLVFDLKIAPADYINKTAPELAAIWLERGKDAPYFPVKEVAFNRCAAVAPVSVLDQKTQQRLGLDMEQITEHQKQLAGAQNFAQTVVEAWQIVDQARRDEYESEVHVDAQLYDGFVSNSDRSKMSALRAAKPDELDQFAGQFSDNRLNRLLPLYKARNWPQSLNQDEQAEWLKFCKQRLVNGGQYSQASQFFNRLNQLQNQTLSASDRFLLEELSLYGQSILPTE